LEQKLNRLRELALNKKFTIRIDFKKFKHSLLLGKTIVVEDKITGSQVKWFQAFGNLTLRDLINNFEIEKISLEKSGEEKVFKSIEEAILFLERI